MNTLKKLWPLLATIVMAIAPVVSPMVQGFWSTHPSSVALLAGAWATFKWLLPSPVAPAPPTS